MSDYGGYDSDDTWWINGQWLPRGQYEKPKPKCECGATIAMGKDDNPSYHSTWCPVKIADNAQPKTANPKDPWGY